MTALVKVIAFRTGFNKQHVNCGIINNAEVLSAGPSEVENPVLLTAELINLTCLNGNLKVKKLGLFTSSHLIVIEPNRLSVNYVSTVLCLSSGCFIIYM